MRVLAILGVCVGLTCGLLAAGSCLVDRKSNEFACSTTTDCVDGRQCMSGFCIASDAPIVPPCAENCTDLGGECVEEVCRFTCTAASCPGIVQCPADLPCEIGCTDAGACGTGIACTTAASCTITCADGACQAPIDCGSSACAITCNGTSCAGEIRCQQADRCVVACNGPNSCAAQILCGNGLCDIDCNGATSCAGGTACSNSCRCDVDCLGVGACGAAATCPKQQCTEAAGCDPTNNGCGPSC
ncbi:MAG: hypothetical protein H0V17_09030 [Deltaproteobacteria bacterium]|nr:hypothetical protein [Deltaproteobacteria bacterium]